MTSGHIINSAHLARLTAIADALGVPVDVFFADPPPSEIEETLTVIRLWSAINDAQGRRRILNLMRQEAIRSGNCN